MADDGGSESSISEAEHEASPRPQSPLPHDMHDQRIVDYTLNSVRPLKVTPLKFNLKKITYIDLFTSETFSGPSFPSTTRLQIR